MNADQAYSKWLNELQEDPPRSAHKWARGACYAGYIAGAQANQDSTISKIEAMIASTERVGGYVLAAPLRDLLWWLKGE